MLKSHLSLRIVYRVENTEGQEQHNMSFAEIKVDCFECEPLSQNREGVKQVHMQKL